MTRRQLREHCFKMIFCADFYPEEEINEQLEEYFQAPDEDQMTPEGVDELLHSVKLDLHDTEYLLKKSAAVIDHIPQLDQKINEVAEGWKTGRMGKVELSILRLALYEILYDDEVPTKVAINEAVDISRKFGGDDSSAFVNGILAKLV